ncbi:MAG: hypothetical protein H8E10_18520 [Desulfobacterales bacterium]|nr:hypothetical protein [Desulfobacterales bacterium]MBL7205126.1 hypothetical protein [Desulfobacteraceae bacterium]
MELILAAIIGGVIVLVGIKFAPKKSILKLLLKMFLVMKDYLLSVIGENLERFKDLFAESKAEYEKEKKAEKEVHMD